MSLKDGVFTFGKGDLVETSEPWTATSFMLSDVSSTQASVNELPHQSSEN